MLHTSAAVRIPLLKLVMAGPSKAGKTALLRALRVFDADPALDLKEFEKVRSKEESSKGNEEQVRSSIEVGTWHVRTVVQQCPITFTTIDCSQKGMPYTMHDIFRSDRAIFVIVFNILDPKVDSTLRYWLSVLRTTSSSCSIVAVATHLNHRDVDRQWAVNR
jgi:GTPase SAR1 family protein